MFIIPSPPPPLFRKRMRCSTNIYLTALAVADIFLLLFVFIRSLEHYPNTEKNTLYWSTYGLQHWFTDAASRFYIYTSRKPGMFSILNKYQLSIYNFRFTWFSFVFFSFPHSVHINLSNGELYHWAIYCSLPSNSRTDFVHGIESEKSDCRYCFSGRPGMVMFMFWVVVCACVCFCVC